VGQQVELGSTGEGAIRVNHLCWTFRVLDTREAAWLFGGPHDPFRRKPAPVAAVAAAAASKLADPREELAAPPNRGNSESKPAFRVQAASSEGRRK